MTPIGWTMGFVGRYTSTASGSAGGGGGDIIFSGSWTDDDVATNNTSAYTFSGMNFGSADAARLIVIAVALGEQPGGGGDAPAITGVTIGGVAGTSVVSALGGGHRVHIWQALVPSGTSGTVVATLASSGYNCSIGVHRIVTGTQAVRNTGTDTGSGLSPLSIAATVPTSGYGVVVVSSSNNPHVPTSYTERYENATGESGGSGNQTHSGGDFTATATIICDTNSNAGAAMAYASWGP
jgi:hypothetical protein